MKRTLDGWKLYVDTLEAELKVRTSDSNTLARIIGIIEAWQDVVSISDNEEVNDAALRAISTITDKHCGQEGL